jgi:hypothetical protein
MHMTWQQNNWKDMGVGQGQLLSVIVITKTGSAELSDAHESVAGQLVVD